MCPHLAFCVVTVKLSQIHYENSNAKNIAKFREKNV